MAIEEPTITDLWGLDLAAAACAYCNWSYLAPPDSLPTLCPNCYQDELDAAAADDLPASQPPELVIPVTLSREQVERSIQTFANRIWFAPPDLESSNLISRLKPIYLPLWLVDAQVQAQWQAEVGFNYNVESHRDNYQSGRWVSQKVTETRIRWEPRLGNLQREYSNVAAPALEDHLVVQKALGPFDQSKAKAYGPKAAANAFIRVPNRLPQDAWQDAQPNVQAAAAEECRQAASADHIRQFRWAASYTSQNWTQLLQPIYSTYYLDDAHQPHPIFIHGQTGRVSGRRRASMKRARRATIIIAIIAAIIFGLSALLALVGAFVATELATIGGIGIVIAILIGLCAIIPLISVSLFNHQEKKKALWQVAPG